MFSTELRFWSMSAYAASGTSHGTGSQFHDDSDELLKHALDEEGTGLAGKWSQYSWCLMAHFEPLPPSRSKIGGLGSFLSIGPRG